MGRLGLEPSLLASKSPRKCPASAVECTFVLVSPHLPSRPVVTRPGRYGVVRETIRETGRPAMRPERALKQYSVPATCWMSSQRTDEHECGDLVLVSSDGRLVIVAVRGPPARL